MADLPDVVAGLLRAALDPVPFYDGRVPATTASRYVVGYFDDGTPSAGDVAHTSDLVTHRWQLTFAAKDTQATRAAVSVLRRKARAALVDVVPDVEGWVFGPIEVEGSRPTVPDQDVTTSPALFGVDDFVCMGARA